MLSNIEKWRLYLRDIESPEIYIEWGFYHLISSALQRRVWMYSDPETLLPCSFSLFPNIYPILVGPPATGKGRVIVQESSIIKSAALLKADATGRQHPLIPYTPDKITLEALTQHIAESVKTATRKHPNHPDKAQVYIYSPCCFLIEELEVLFAEHTNDMVAVLTKCYDATDMHYKTKNQGQDKIVNVCISMIAGTTPQSIKDLMASKVVKKGMASRMIMIYADKPRFYRRFPGIDTSQQQAYVELVEHIKMLTTVLGEVRLSPEATKWDKEYYESGEMHRQRVNKDIRLDDYYSRRNINALKLAMILHYAEQHTSQVIQLETVKRAYTVLTSAELRMHESFMTTGRNILYESCLEIERYLEEKVSVTYKKTWWDFSRDLKKTEFDECVEIMTQTGRMVNSGGILTLGKNGSVTTNGQH